MIHHLTISTGCCPESNKHKVVRLMFDFDYETFESYGDLKPVWKSFGFDTFKNDRSGYKHEKHVNVNNCPFCGAKTPEIELNQEAIDNHKIHNGDLDYCAICDERNMCCRCLPPEFRWKPVGIDVEIPIIPNDEDDEE